METQVQERSGAQAPGRWARLGLPAVLVFAALAYGWGSHRLGFGYPYYSAAVRTMSGSVTAFLFGTVDPLGVVTVDKPPMALWFQVLSTGIFGFHGWALVLPQVVQGVAAVWLLHRTVRRWLGDGVALAAAVLLAVTPVTVAMTRDTMPDPLMVLLMVAAAYAVTRAIGSGERERGWVLLAAFLMGCAFLTKMMQGWLVLPALLAAYLVGATTPWRTRATTLVLGAAVLVVSSSWWVVLVDLWPAPHPFVGSSVDGTARDLVLGYNGLGRLAGQDFPAAASYAEENGKAFYQSDPGPLRMFGNSLGGQASWLLPLALAGVVGAAVAAARRSLPRDVLAGWVLWGGWLVVALVVFSGMRGIWLAYYTATLAPAVAALAAASGAVLLRWYRGAGRGWPLLPVAVGLLGLWSWAVVGRAPEYLGWLSPLVAVLTVVAVVALVAGRTVLPRAARAGAVVGVVAVLLAPAAWSVAAAAGYAAGLPMLPVAGPVSTQVDYLPEEERQAFADELGGWGAAAERAAAGELDEINAAILDHAEREGAGARIPLAVETADAAAPFILADRVPVVGMAGFTGRDPAPSVPELGAWIDRGEVAFVLLLPFEGEGSYEFVRDRCVVVPPETYASDEDLSLYDCRPS